MPSFNFDIVIIIIVLFSIIRGYNRGIYRQLSSSVAIIIPVLFIQFWGSDLYAWIVNIPVFQTISNFIYKGIRFVSNANEVYIQKILLYTVMFIIMYYLLKLVFKIFSPSREARILNEISNSSKFVGASLGLLVSYFLIVIGFIIIKPITNIVEDKPLTEIIISSNSIINEDFVISLPSED